MGIILPSLCLVTDSKRFSVPVEDVVEQAVEAGVNMVQLREREMSSERLLELAISLRDITRGKALLFVNRRVDIAVASGADGVQLGEESVPILVVRRMGGGLIIGKSVHGVKKALQAERDGADFLMAGTIFPTDSHPGLPTRGLEFIRQLRRSVSIPLLAIGGIRLDSIASVMESGASGAAAIGAIGGAPAPGKAAEDLLKAMNDAWAARDGI